ncbi:MAG: helix-turn-helix transcriptional regulator [Burkholderiaceae bacterium]
MAFDLADIGARVRAYRLGAGYNADQLASKLGVSRAALYRIEQGDIVKIDVLQNIASILGTSLASLLGAGAEYHSNAASYQKRMQQLEKDSSHIVALFSPVSYLLTTEEYDDYLALMIQESRAPAGRGRAGVKGDRTGPLMETLGQRRLQAQEKAPSITCLFSLEELRRLLTLGLVGRLGLPAATVAKRRQAAQRQVQHLAKLMRLEPVGIQIGVVEHVVPNMAFQLFYKDNEVLLGTSPFRIGELPNLDVGVAMITSSKEAVDLHVQLFDGLWSNCQRGREGARLLEGMLD